MSKIHYGTTWSNIDVTEIAITHCIVNGILTIPEDDRARANIFGDPLPGIVKSIFITLLNEEQVEYDEHTFIEIENFE
jgi:hypothetical protein